MSQPRLRLESCRFENGVWKIDAEQAKHLVKVRRCYNGSVVEGLLDGEKIELRLENCETEEICAVELSRTKEKKAAREIQLLLALLKNDQFDEALRFAAETGVSEIYLLACERSVPKITDRLGGKMTRWNKILAEATKQSGAATPPVLHEPVPFEKFDFPAVCAEKYAALLAENAQPLARIAFGEKTALAIGPEGDWTPEETRRLLAEGFVPVSLGNRILRASTAVAVACGWLGNVENQEAMTTLKKLSINPKKFVNI